MIRTRCIAFYLLALGLLQSSLRAQGIDVTVAIVTKQKTVAHTSQTAPPKGVVVWLTPLVPASSLVAPGHFRLIQKDKSFRPHLLVIPVGSTVTFPNQDPFFHNVFSLFNGKRFDLGLYEAGASRDVTFTHEGVSYIFCNIHPEMSGVILALATPYYGISDHENNVTLHAVPPGTYRMSVWAEGVEPDQLQALARTVDVGPLHDELAPLEITKQTNPAPHTNKFGEPYSNTEPTPYEP